MKSRFNFPSHHNVNAIALIRFIFVLLVMGVVLKGCSDDKPSASADDYAATIMTLDPGHFHSFLIQKNMYPDVNPIAYVYAPEGGDVQLHLDKIKQYNSREENPTHWVERVYTGPDFVDKMFSDKPGNVMVVAGNNRNKTDYILRAVKDSVHVFSDKPMAINGENYRKLKSAFEIAQDKGLAIYDIMTQRFEITSLLQKKFSSFESVFGRVAPNSLEKPAIVQKSVHYISKEVSGKPLTRPAWFFDIEQQGSGVVDITTHLVDLIMWTLFSKENLQPSDVSVEKAEQWPTEITPDQFKKVTSVDPYPQYLHKSVVNDSVLQLYSNGAITFKIKNFYGKASVIWNYEAPPGGHDTYFSSYRGTLSNLIIRQDSTTGYIPSLFIEPVGSFDRTKWVDNVVKAVEVIRKEYPGIDYEEIPKGFKITIPDKLREDHEALFAKVTNKYLNFLKTGTIPQWEKDFILTKYYITTEAYELSKHQLQPVIQ